MSIEYVKYNPFRRKEFALKTIIENVNGKIQVKKKSLDIQAEKFVKKIIENRQLLTNEYKQLVVCGAEANNNDNEIIFDYVKGITLQESVLKTIECNDKKGFIDILYVYKEILTDQGRIPLKKTSELTDEFYSVFGVVPNGYTFEYLPVSNIDMSFDNLVVNDDKLTMIDYEWVFSFPLPINYVIYRNVITFYNKFKNKLDKNKFISVEEVFKLFNIYENDINIFAQMENSFQNYVHGNNSNIYNKYLKETYYLNDILELKQREASNSIAQFFWDDGTSFNEVNALNIDINIQNRNEQSIEFTVNEIKSIFQNDFRIDICKLPCAIKIIEIYVKYADFNRKLNISHTNANVIDGNCYAFFHDDPQFIFDKLENTEIEIEKIILKVQFIDFNLYASTIVHKFKEKETELLMINSQLLDENSNMLNKNNDLTNTIDELISKNNKLSITSDEIESKNNELSVSLHAIELELNNKKEELIKVYSSKRWKLINILGKFILYRR
ncbi:hypothetical protein LJR153_006063 [Paenibacillus sp. LjRoot153]|uniref:hypothetical protein n=1 Tax=Paenibacillus sp. LjRoot153 TaxID=3342270 RepID=UPI003ECD43B3